MVAILQLFTACGSNGVEKVKSLGTKEFKSNEWRLSGNSKRSEMIYSFLKNNKITDMNNEQIHKLLGESTAYYEYDEFPAYILVSGGYEYIVAFPIDRDTQKIRKYIFQPELN